DCELGMLRRAPGTAAEPTPALKTPTKGGIEQKPATSTADSKAPEVKGVDAISTIVPPVDQQRQLLPTTVFKDCDTCPNMVVGPAGDFEMGSPDSELGRLSVEGPRHKVSIARPFAAGRFAVTRDEFAAFVAASGYHYGTSCQAEVADKW